MTAGSSHYSRSFLASPHFLPCAGALLPRQVAAGRSNSVHGENRRTQTYSRVRGKLVQFSGCISATGFRVWSWVTINSLRVGQPHGMHQGTESTVYVPSHPLHGSQSHANCPFLTHPWSQVAAAFAELAIPHFATSSIFAAATAGATSASFQHYLQLLGVLVVVFGVSAALRGYCFSVLNNRMTMRLRCGAGVGVWCGS